ncbi:MAG: nucleotidyltransferase domain-containing protein [Chloroflexia bacterium]
MTDQDTEQIYRKLREALAGRPEVAFAYLHGSFLQGLPYHDLDVALYLRPEAEDPFDYEMQRSVEWTLLLDLPVDVRVLNDAPLGFQHTVLRGRPIFVRDEALLTAFIEQVGRAYAEFAYLGRAYLREVTS